MTRNPVSHVQPMDFYSPRKPKYSYSNNIHDYEIQEMLGRGGFGFVHKALTCLHGQTQPETVAIKMIDKKRMREANMTTRVANEVELHWQLHHPSILKLNHYFEDANYVYLVMELCTRGELYQYLSKRQAPLSEAETRGMMIPIIQGLQYLHGNGIIHRDLKLSNILLTESLEPKIADFGLAVKLTNPQSSEQKTMCGTPNYLSPEIVSRMPYGLSSDLWSLGCLLYTLLIGKPPFDSLQVQNTLDKVCKVDYDIPKGLSHAARDLIHCLLQKDPKKRLTTQSLLRHAFFHSSLPVHTLCKSNTVLQKSLSIQKKPTRVLSESLDPTILNSERLKPLKQKTKHGWITIDQQGNVILDFEDEKYLLVIPSDGSRMDIYSKSLDWETARPMKSVSRESMNTSLLKRYQYACKFIQLVKSKTPKIIFYSPQAKCMLMENTPNPDFEMIFSSTGIKIQYSGDKKTFTLKNPKEQTPCLLVLSELDTPFDSSKSHSLLFKHAQECLKHCLEALERSTSDPSTHFPLIIKSSSRSTNRSFCPSESCTSPQPSLHPSALSTFSGWSVKTTKNSQPMPLDGGQKSILSTTSAATMSMDKEPSVYYMKQVGWMYKFNDRKFQMLFHDGISVTIDAKDQSLIYKDAMLDFPQSFKIDRNLPENAKAKLSFFPQFLKLIKSPST